MTCSSSMPVLDVCCGPRMMWFDKKNPLAVFLDKRSETITVRDRSHGKEDGTRTVSVQPDIVASFTDLPFGDCSFRLVAFDPPHLERAGPKSWLAAKYGKLPGNWREDLKKGFEECFRVLCPGGTLVFKWNETQIKTKEVIALCPYPPLFGQVSGAKGLTHFLVFMKPVKEGASL